MNKPITPKPRQIDNRSEIVNVPASPQNQENKEMTIDRIKKLKQLSDYNIRELVKDASDIGQTLKNGGLKTNQIRKFLDAINRVKARLLDESIQAIKDKDEQFKKIEVDIVLLKPKLAYAAKRESPAEPLKKVLDAAIDKTLSISDFDRLVQFVESIIAYHKAAGGE
jgi:CRISPR-associated protein Csm2